MAKKLSPFNFTKAVVRSFMAESGLEPRYEQIPTKALFITYSRGTAYVLTDSIYVCQTASQSSMYWVFQIGGKPRFVLTGLSSFD